MEEYFNRNCRRFLFIMLLLLLLLLLVGCNFVQVQTDLPVHTTKVMFVNNTSVPLSFFVDGVEKVVIPPAETKTFGYWVGGGPYYSTSIQVSVTVLDRQNNRSWSDVVYFSSYYKYSYVFTAREGYQGRLEVERR